MSPDHMRDYPPRRYQRRAILKGTAAVGLAAVAGPTAWRQSDAWASGPAAPQWIAYGAHPSTQMYLSWSTGTASGTQQAPPHPQVRWGLDASYGATQPAANSGPVPVPPAVHGEPAENTIYNNTLLTGLDPGTRYHYSVSNDGVTWGPDTTFRTAPAGAGDFRFAAFGDQGTHQDTTLPMAALVASHGPAFCLVAGDLGYATAVPSPIPHTKRFKPAAWDAYLGIVGPAAAQSIPWQAGVGCHEIEPLASHGYAGFITRFPQPYDAASGSPVVYAFSYANVAFIHLDGNDLSAQAPQNNGYTQGAQTSWLAGKLAAYRAPGSGIDFIVAIFGNCMFSSNQKHNSDGGIRSIWQPLFDQHHVDLVINGHVHAYERTNPMRAGKPTATVPSGGTVHPQTGGTTYICVGGGGQGLYRDWYGTTGAGDAGAPKPPRVWEWSGGDSSAGGSGKPADVADSATGYSAFRHACWHCLVVDVEAPAGPGGETRMHVRALAPAQTLTRVTSITSPRVIDSVTLLRRSQPAAGPGRAGMAR